MTTGTAIDAARETRRVQLRQIYTTWLASDVAALKAARAATFRRLLPGCALGAAVLVLAGAAIVSAAKSASPWSDAWVLGRIVLGVAALAWFTRRFLLAAPDAGDAAMHAQDRQLDALVGRLVAQIRPGATYEPFDRLEEDWPSVARLVDANRHHASYVVRWSFDDVRVTAAEAGASFYRTAADGTLDDQTGETRFAGWVAIVRLPQPRPWAVRVRSRASAYADTCDDARFAPVPVAGLSDGYDVRGTSADGVTQVMTADVVARLAEAERRQLATHVAVAGSLIVIALELRESWFHRLHPRLDQEHAVALGEVLDTLHALAAGVVRGLAPAPARR